MNGVTEQAEASGYSIILKELASFDVPDIVPVVEFLLSHRVEGIIFAPPQMGANIKHVMEQLPPGCPPVVFLKAEPTPAYTTIGIDNQAAAALAVNHLLSLGRTRIAHVAGPLEWREARDRRDAWLAAVQKAGLEPGPMAVSSWSSAGGATAFAQLLDEDPEIDGLFAASDQIALGALHVANARGIRIPEQLAVVGFDGLPEAAQYTPSLTTVRQPLADMGMLAVQELLAGRGRRDRGLRAARRPDPGGADRRRQRAAAKRPARRIRAARSEQVGAVESRHGRHRLAAVLARSATPTAVERGALDTAGDRAEARQPVGRRGPSHRPRRDLDARVVRPPHRLGRDRPPLDRDRGAPEAERQRQRCRAPGRPR